MSYPDISAPDFEGDLLGRKEFYQFHWDPERHFRDPNSHDNMRGKHFQLHSHQLFVRNFTNPNTPYMRLLLKHSTGSGKTASSVAIAQAFIEVYKKFYQLAVVHTGTSRRALAEVDKQTPSVFVIGFTKINFIKELLKYPEFGFISIGERDELAKLRSLAQKSGLAADIKRAKEFLNIIKKRITNKQRDGFYKFFGYQEFVNRLFVSDEVNLTDLETLATQQFAAGDVNGQPKTLEDIVHEYIDAGRISINQSLLAQFENSLIICDEIHNTYNSYMKNNYGVAIQYVLDYHPTVRAIFMSATPINNSPSEVVDLVNYLVPTSGKISKRDFFINSRTLRAGKLEEIGKLVQGRV